MAIKASCTLVCGTQNKKEAGKGLGGGSVTTLVYGGHVQWVDKAHRYTNTRFQTLESTEPHGALCISFWSGLMGSNGCPRCM